MIKKTTRKRRRIDTYVVKLNPAPDNTRPSIVTTKSKNAKTQETEKAVG